jgi:glycosyl transferase family 87
MLRRHSWTARRVLFALTLLLLLLLLWRLSVARASRETVVHSDFGAFWLQGYYFLTGRPLFDLPPHVRGPAYPPFAAMVFQLFALLPLPTSAAILVFVNLLLVPVAVYLTKVICDALHPERNRAAWPLVVAFVLSAQFFLNNMNLIQLNEVILVLCLLGIKAYLDGKDGWAAAAFVTAAGIKLVPAVFAVWLVARGRRRAALAVFVAGAACLALPLAFRGVRAGVRDLAEYHAKVLGRFERGHVISTSLNQNLGALVYRLTVAAPDDFNPDYHPLLPVSEPVAAAIYRTAFAIVLLAFISNLVLLRWHHAPLTAFELGSVFLAGHLLSGITWKAHLVTFLFTFYCFLSLRMTQLTPWLRAFVYLLVGMMMVTGLTGRDLVGRKIQHLVDGYGLIVWTEILLLVGCLVFSWRTAPMPRPAVATSV